MGGVFLLASCASADGARTQTDQQADEEALAAVRPVPYKDLCDAPGPREMRCHAKIVTQPNGEVVPMANPSGLGPADLRSAYALPSSGGNGKTIAIVDAYDAPNAEADLGKYRQQYGLPACTTANGCFKKVNQDGVEGSYPTRNSGWAGEIALDLDMASAACPDCKILLVEANSATGDDLGTGVNTAAQLGAAAISNSYGGGEDSTVSGQSAQYYNHPGILITVSAGDQGYGAQFPASSEHVLAVGGTKLVKSSSTRGWAETAWTSGGSGCSRYITKQSWQTDTGCAKRTVADVAAVGDPNTGVAVYNGGWEVVGGTSASAPLIAGIWVLLGIETQDGSYPYMHASAFYDVTSGSNGSCGGTYLCSAKTGYDGPTGVGTPNGALLGGGTVVPDAGPPPVDSGTTVDAGHDSGTGVDAGHDSGSTGHDGGTQADASGGDDASIGDDDDASTGDDSGLTPPVDSGKPVGGGSSGDAGKKKDSGSGSGDGDTGGGPGDSSGCGCVVPGSHAPVNGGSAALLAFGAMALVVTRRRRR